MLRGSAALWWTTLAMEKLHGLVDRWWSSRHSRHLEQQQQLEAKRDFQEGHAAASKGEGPDKVQAG